jgi:aldehyde dehydrogenase (NAD+)
MSDERPDTTVERTAPTADGLELASYVGGEWEQGTGDEVEDLNPAHPEEVVATYRRLDPSQVDQAVDAAAVAFPSWRRTSIHERAGVLLRAGRLLEERAERIGRELAREQGRREVEAVAEVRRAADIFRYFSAEADRAEGDCFTGRRDRERVLTTRVPLGPVLLITPWNVPVAIPAWKLAPALVHGNTVIWKPSGIVPLMAVRLAEALIEAGLPAGVCNLVLTAPSVGSTLLRDERVRAGSFTGSTAVGKALQAIGGASGKPLQAEMGGKNAAIVLADADLELAADQVVSAAMGWTGQRCTATSRLLVEGSVAADLIALVNAKVAALRVGDPLDPATDVGPVASRSQHEQVRRYLEVAREEGAELVVGGGSSDPDDGYFVDPTVALKVEPGHRIFDEEVFGPLLAVRTCGGFEEALELANRGRYGLSAALFTTDLDRALAAVDALEVGVLHVNSETCGSDPHVPFGGTKDSGTGDREMGAAGRAFYTAERTVYVRPGRAG